MNYHVNKFVNDTHRHTHRDIQTRQWQYLKAKTELGLKVKIENLSKILNLLLWQISDLISSSLGVSKCQLWSGCNKKQSGQESTLTFPTHVHKTMFKLSISKYEVWRWMIRYINMQCIVQELWKIQSRQDSVNRQTGQADRHEDRQTRWK